MSHSFWKLEIQHQGHQHGWFLVRGFPLVADGCPYTLGGGVPSFCSLTLLSKGLIWEVKASTYQFVGVRGGENSIHRTGFPKFQNYCDNQLRLTPTDAEIRHYCLT